MTTRSQPGPGQGELLPTEPLEPCLPPGYNLNRKITFSKMITIIAGHAQLSPSTTTEEDLELIDPSSIEAALYVPWKPGEDSPKGSYRGVMFPSKQFSVVARSPEDLAESVFMKTLAANDKKPKDERETNRDVVNNRAHRSVAHALEAKIVALDKLHVELHEEKVAIEALRNSVRAGGWARYTAGRLDGFRKVVDGAIAEAIEVAARSLPDLKSADVDRVQSAKHYNLYGHRNHNNRRMGYWDQYGGVVERWGRARIHALESSRRHDKEVLEPYLPYLETAEHAEPA